MSQHFYPEILETGATLGLTLATGSITVDLNQSFLVQGLRIDTNDRNAGTGVGGLEVDITGFTSEASVHLRYSMDGEENTALGLDQDQFYAVLAADDTAGTSSTAYDLYIADFSVDASNDATIIEYVVNKSRLVVDTIDSVTHNASTTTPISVSATTFTLNDAEAGAGVTGGTAGLIIDRGTSDNYQLLLDDNSTPHLTAGTTSAMKKVAVFSTTPVSGQILSAADALGNLTSSTNLTWDATNKRLAVDQAGTGAFTVSEAIHTDGNVQAGQWLIMGHATPSIGFNSDKNDKFIVNGYASKLVSSGGTFTIYVSDAMGTAGNSVSWDSLYAWNELGNVGFNIAASTTASEAVSIGGSLYMSASAPKINVNDTSASAGFQIDVDGISIGANPFFTLYDTDDVSNVFQITYDRNVQWSSSLFNLQSPDDSADTVLHIQSVDNEARLIFNSTDGLYSTANVASIFQYSEDHGTYPKALFVTTGTGAGNIVLAPKYDGASSATGYVGINKMVPTVALDVVGTAKIYQSSLPSMTLQNGAASWLTYISGVNDYRIGISTAAYAMRVATGHTDFDDDMVWNRTAKTLGLGYTVVSGGESYKFYVQSTGDTQMYLSSTDDNVAMTMDSYTNANAVIKYVQSGTSKFTVGMFEDTAIHYSVYNEALSTNGLKIYSLTNDVEFDGGSFYYDVSEDRLGLGIGDYATYIATTSEALVNSSMLIYGDSSLTSGAGGVEYQVDTTTNGSGFRTFAGIATDLINYTIAYRYTSDSWTNVLSMYYDDSASVADESLYMHFGTVDAATDATAKSALTIAGFENSAIGEAGGIEFKMLASDSGYGVRIVPTRTSGETSLTIAHRYNSASWVASMSIGYDDTNSRSIINIDDLPTYATNALAIIGGLGEGDLFIENNSSEYYIRIVQPYT